jgi:hypothetical protein
MKYIPCVNTRISGKTRTIGATPKKYFRRLSNIQKLPDPDIRAISEPYIRTLGNGENRVNLLWLTAPCPEGVMNTIIGQSTTARGDQPWKTFSSMWTS